MKDAVRTNMNFYGLITFPTIAAATAAKREMRAHGAKFIRAKLFDYDAALLPTYVNSREIVSSLATIPLYKVIMPCSTDSGENQHICWADVDLVPTSSAGIYRLIVTINGDDRYDCSSYDECRCFNFGYVLLSGAACWHIEQIEQDFNEMFPCLI